MGKNAFFTTASTGRFRNMFGSEVEEPGSFTMVPKQRIVQIGCAGACPRQG
jgi:hypothetical protein